MSYVPTTWEAILLGLAAFRVWRLLAADTILDWPRNRLVRREEFWEGPDFYREKLDRWLHCPWCMGFWVTMGWWGAWLVWPHATMIVAVPWAISAFVGLVQRNYDP